MVPEGLQIDDKPARVFFHQSKATLLSVSYAAFSDAAVSSFTSHFPDLPSYHLRPILNPLKWLLWSRLIPAAPNSKVLRGDLPEAVEVFKMCNKVAAYVFLIDSASRIRWRAAGPANEAELLSLRAAIKELSK